MIRNCSVRSCREPAIRDGRECSEHIREMLRDTRPEWMKRAAAKRTGMAKDMTGLEVAF